MITLRRIPAQQFQLVLAFMMVIFLLALLKSAWIADDAAITLRTVLNFLAGHGAVFNIGERVQAYTHPLWFGLVSLATVIVGNVFYAAILCSVLLSLVALWLLLARLSRSTEWTIFVGLCLLLSSAFRDFAVSGLENPLAFLLLAFYGLVLTSDRLTGTARLRLLALLFSLGFLTRPDLVIFFVPGLVYQGWMLKKPLPIVLSSLPGFLPLVVWIVFSLIYYGFPLPNPAYAKLGTGLPTGELLVQGVYYFLDSINRDPVTLLFTAFAIAAALHARDRISLLLATGVSLYLLYVLSIGGDFMSGRFFSQVIFASAVLLVLQPRPEIFTLVLLSAFVLLASFLLSARPLPGKEAAREVPANGIVDERAFWYPDTGLANGDRNRFREFPDWSEARPVPGGMDVKDACGGLGFRGLHAGPNVHYIDTCGLAEPLLARLPVKYDNRWRVGHYLRNIPVNYAETLRTGVNSLEDAALAEYLNKLNTLTKGPIFSWDRLKTVVAFNLGRYNHLVNEDYYRQLPVGGRIQLQMLAGAKMPGAPWDALGNFLLEAGKPLIVLVEVGSISGRLLEISLDHSDTYILRVKSGTGRHWSTSILPEPGSSGLRVVQLPLPDWLDARTISELEIEAVEGDGLYSVGHLIFR